MHTASALGPSVRTAFLQLGRRPALPSGRVGSGRAACACWPARALHQCAAFRLTEAGARPVLCILWTRAAVSPRPFRCTSARATGQACQAAHVMQGCEWLQGPYISREHLPLPPLRLRLALVAAQMLAYHQRFQPAPAELQLFKAAVAAAGDALGAEYRRNAVAEFVAAAREAHERAEANGNTAAAAEAAPAAGEAAPTMEGAGATDDDIVDEVPAPPTYTDIPAATHVSRL